MQSDHAEVAKVEELKITPQDEGKLSLTTTSVSTCWESANE